MLTIFPEITGGFGITSEPDSSGLFSKESHDDNPAMAIQIIALSAIIFITLIICMIRCKYSQNPYRKAVCGQA